MAGIIKYELLLLVIYFVSDCTPRVKEGDGVSRRYLIYSVNPGEGFNLRRDVHMRAATLVKKLRTTAVSGEDWILVLPPWPHLYHWKSRSIDQMNWKWENFFDVARLDEYVPTIEFEEYIQQEGTKIDEVIRLQNFEKWDSWEEKAETTPCTVSIPYKELNSRNQIGTVFGVGDVVIGSFRCLSVMGFSHTLIPQLQKRSTLVERFEVVLHSEFGGLEYWMSRASMVYAQHLRDEGNRFMQSSLSYDPGTGNGRQSPQNGGGNFLSVHLRRADYRYARPDEIPSLEGAAKQINTLKQHHGLKKVFLATDASLSERETFAKLVEDVVWYTPSEHNLHHYGDGGVAIIDQWIAAHAKFFIGSTESTFSFRIREDRQLMGFSKESTYNQLCGTKYDENNHTSCDPPTYWKAPQEVLKKFADDSQRTGQSRTEL